MTDPRITRYWPALLLGVGIAFTLASVISYKTYIMAWDEMYLMHRALDTHFAIYARSLAALDGTFNILAKSPVLPLLSVVWGPNVPAEGLIGLNLVALGTLTYSIIVLCFRLASRVQVSPIALFLAGATLACNQTARLYAGAFLSDILLSWLVVLLMACVVTDTEDRDRGGWHAIGRGCLWGMIISLGALTKTTFGFFLALCCPVSLWFAFRNRGYVRALTSIVAAGVVCIPAGLLWLRYGHVFIAHSFAASWGGVSKYYGTGGSSFGGHLLQIAQAIGWGWVVIAICVAMAMRSGDRRGNFLSLYLLSVVLVYGAVCATSVNFDPRFLLPITIGLPFVAALGWRKTREAGPVVSPAFWPTMLLAGVLLCIPMAIRPDLQFVRVARQTLDHAARVGAKRVLICTDSGPFNVETLLLAQQLDRLRFGAMEIDTIAYDHINQRPVSRTIEKIRQANVVVFETPFPTVPDFTNVRTPMALEQATLLGEEQHPDRLGGVRVFQIKQ